MKLSPQARNFFKLVELFDGVELPDGKELIGRFDTVEDRFSIHCTDGKKEVSFGVMDNISLMLWIHEYPEDDYSGDLSIHVPAESSIDELRDLVYNVVKNHLLYSIKVRNESIS